MALLAPLVGAWPKHVTFSLKPVAPYSFLYNEPLAEYAGLKGTNVLICLFSGHNVRTCKSAGLKPHAIHIQ